MVKAINLADQLVEYLNSDRINPLECWPLLEQLNAELDRVLGPPGEFPNCHPRLLARKITDSVPTLWLLDFSVPDIDLAMQFRGTRNEATADELRELRLNLLTAVKGWKRKIPSQKIEIRVACIWNDKRVYFRREAPQLPSGVCWMVGMSVWEDEISFDIESITVDFDGSVTLWIDDIKCECNFNDDEFQGWIDNGWVIG